MKKILFLAAAATLCLGFASAQERFVSEDAQYRKALLEEYTGIHCGYCPDGHRRANDLKKKFPDDLFLINIHVGGYAVPGEGEIDLRTQYGTALNNNAGVSAYPAGSVSRHIFSGSATATDRGSWATNVPKILDMPAYVNIAAKGTLDWMTRELKVTVQLYYTGDATVSSNFIHVALTQDNIIGTQSDYGDFNPDQTLPDGKYIHNHAFRDFLTGQWGEEITTVTKGSFVEKTYTKVLPEIIGNVNVELMDLNVIAFVTETRNEVVNACQAEITDMAPGYVVRLSDMKQALDNTCDNTVRFSCKLETAIAAEPITSIVFYYESEAGNGEFEYKPDAALTVGNTYTFETAPLVISRLSEDQTYSIKVTKINGEDATSNMVSADAIKMLALSRTHDININIWQDRYGSDITWVLKEIGGDILASGGPYPDLSGNTTSLRTTKATIADGCYAFTIYDKMRDGINNGSGNGHLSFTDADNVDFMTHDGKYKDSLRYVLRFSPAGNEKDQLAYHAVLAPNPANEYSVLSFELPAAQTVRVRVIANNGACVLDLGNKNLSAGKQDIVLPTNNLTEGLYLIQVSGKKLKLTQKLMIVR